MQTEALRAPNPAILSASTQAVLKLLTATPAAPPVARLAGLTTLSVMFAVQVPIFLAQPEPHGTEPAAQCWVQRVGVQV